MAKVIKNLKITPFRGNNSCWRAIITIFRSLLFLMDLNVRELFDRLNRKFPDAHFLKHISSKTGSYRPKY